VRAYLVRPDDDLERVTGLDVSVTQRGDDFDGAKAADSKLARLLDRALEAF
jgi:hypothetical protein